MSLSSVDSSLSLLGCLVLCYVPHLIRAVLVHRRLASLKAAGRRCVGGYDLRAPRECVAAATDETPECRLIARLSAAHNHHLENFPFIAAAVLLARVSGVPLAAVNSRALVYAALRAGHVASYALSISPVRVLAFIAGMAVVCVVLGVGVFAVVLYASYKYLWPPLNQVLNTPKVAPPAKKPSPPPKVKAEPTPNDTGFCYVGEWQGVRSCVPLKGGTCAGDLYPTAAECSNPNLR
jgi:uncharacterized MAPEG superfamily protein